MTQRSDWPCGWRPGETLLRNEVIHERCGWPWRAHLDRPEGEPHHPNRWYLCDDPDCCYDGCPILTCAVCSEDWPCPTKREHVEARRATVIDQ
jgi:hypothetical protein